MPGLPGLSVEVWQMILRFSIAITGFLDPDTFEGDLMAHGFGHEDRSANDPAPYWESERTRNTLRRVCKAWDAYLRRFEHRYVRMEDVIQRRIDRKSMQKAIRISFPQDEFTRREVYLQLCCETLLGLHDLPAEIIDIDAIFGGSLWNSGALRSLKELKTVVAWQVYGETITVPLFSQTPSLKHILGMVYDSLQHLQFISRTLVTFFLSVDGEDSYKTLILDLPALRHFRICFEKRPSMIFETVLIPFFGKVGVQLRSFHWDHRYQMPVEIWERCPHLEILHPGMALPASVPVLHQVHTLLVTKQVMRQTLKSQWPKLRRLIFHSAWSTLCDSKQLSKFFAPWAHKFQGSGVTFEDVGGTALESVMKTRGLI